MSVYPSRYGIRVCSVGLPYYAVNKEHNHQRVLQIVLRNHRQQPLRQVTFISFLRTDWFKNCLKIIGGETMKKLDPKDELYDRGALNTAEQLGTALERKDMFGSGESTGS